MSIATKAYPSQQTALKVCMPSATAREFQRAARKLGFVFQPTTGSHERWNHPDGRSVTISLQGGREIGPPLFHKILRQRGISLEMFAGLK
ncbi:MAG: type II toxin-antitoxin system HicA family toxin [Candidatus Acidiferrales bacterium]|jgi:predicted RNA binding protein YcfA (HicA-like mRNA interferase family)